MKTPYGFECAYFYGNYYRGKNVEECRLIGYSSISNDWKVSMCKKCPVPGILQANSCPEMVLKGQIQSSIFGLNKYVTVTAHCAKTGKTVKEPHIGCGLCHSVPNIFEKNS